MRRIIYFVFFMASLIASVLGVNKAEAAVPQTDLLTQDVTQKQTANEKLYFADVIENHTDQQLIAAHYSIRATRATTATRAIKATIPAGSNTLQTINAQWPPQRPLGTYGTPPLSAGRQTRRPVAHCSPSSGSEILIRLSSLSQAPLRQVRQARPVHPAPLTPTGTFCF